MKIFKIINITNSLGKRDVNYNTTLDIEYVDDFEKKKIKIKPNEIIYLTVRDLPLSLHRYRVKNCVMVMEIDKKELKELMETDRNDVSHTPKKKIESEKKINIPITEKKKIKTHPKKSSNKSNDNT